MELVVPNVKHGIELGHMQHVMHFLCQVQQLQLAPGIAYGSERSDQLTHTGAVDVIHLSQIENDLLLAVRHQLAHSIPQKMNLISQHDAPPNIQDRDVSNFPRFNQEGHETGLLPAGRNTIASISASQ